MSQYVGSSKIHYILGENGEKSSKILLVNDETKSRSESPPRIRSFVVREGRMTPAQHRALTELWEQFGVDNDRFQLEPQELFGRKAPLVVEIGFGNGESLAMMASVEPAVNFLGLEVHRPGIGHLLLCAEKLRLSNLRIMRADAVEVVEHRLPDQSVDRFQIFFPDPWPKTRHRKRRLIQPAFLGMLAAKLKASGQLHIATDHADYAYTVLQLLSASPGWSNLSPNGGFIPRPAYRGLTKFEERGCKLGHPVWDILFAHQVVGE